MSAAKGAECIRRDGPGKSTNDHHEGGKVHKSVTMSCSTTTSERANVKRPNQNGQKTTTMATTTDSTPVVPLYGVDLLLNTVQCIQYRVNHLQMDAKHALIGEGGSLGSKHRCIHWSLLSYTQSTISRLAYS